MLNSETNNNNIDFIFTENNFLCVYLDPDIYRKENIIKAVYKFTDKCYVHMETIDENKFIVRFKVKDKNSNTEILANEFCNELLEQELRSIIAQETEPVRNIIMAHAFSKTALIAPEMETADYVEDTQKIAKKD